MRKCELEYVHKIHSAYVPYAQTDQHTETGFMTLKEFESEILYNIRNIYYRLSSVITNSIYYSIWYNGTCTSNVSAGVLISRLLRGGL